MSGDQPTPKPISTVLATIKIRGRHAWWVILDCGHWVKWTGGPAKVDSEFQCPGCRLPQLDDRRDGGVK